QHVPVARERLRVFGWFHSLALESAPAGLVGGAEAIEDAHVALSFSGMIPVSSMERGLVSRQPLGLRQRLGVRSAFARIGGGATMPSQPPRVRPDLVTKGI